jgi:hypothetical protein
VRTSTRIRPRTGLEVVDMNRAQATTRKLELVAPSYSPSVSLTATARSCSQPR